MDNSEYINFMTHDRKLIKLNKRIARISKLFDNIFNDYKINRDTSLNNILSGDIGKIIKFCEMINYEPLIIKKPFVLLSIEEHLKSLNEETQIFFCELNSLECTKYAKLADFYDIPSMEDIIHLKLHTIFQSNEMNSFFQDECPKIKSIPEIDQAREDYLRSKYIGYCENIITQMSDEDVLALSEKYLN